MSNKIWGRGASITAPGYTIPSDATGEIYKYVNRIECEFMLYLVKYFEPVECFENTSDIVMFLGCGYSTGKSIPN